MTKRIVMSMLAWALLAAGPAVRAGGLPEFKCGAGKQKAVSKKEAGLLNCYAKNVLKPDPTKLGPCVSKAGTGLTSAFAKIALKPPPCPGDATAVEAEVDSCVGIVLDTISSDGMGTVPPGQEKCVSGKLKAAGKGAAAKVGCYSKETGKGGLCSTTVATPCGIDTDCPSGETCIAVPPAKVCAVSLAKCTSDAACGGGGPCVDACLKKATDKLTLALQKAGAAAPCVGSVAGIEATIDGNCVTTITNGLPGKKEGCGNGVIEPALNETCDDGNVADGDGCPQDCHVDTCQPVTGTATAHVTYTPPAGITVAGLQVFVDYPEGKVHAPSVSHPFGVNGSASDLGYGINDALVKNPPAALPSTIMTINFANLCQGASAAVAADFSCVVTDASDDASNAIDLSAHPIPCSVTVP
jgi:cysteine-rich repeat protein